MKNIVVLLLFFLTLISSMDTSGKPEYLTYIPDGYSKSKGVILLIHSKGYDWKNYLEWAKPIADKMNMVLIVPSFRKEEWKDYAVIFKEDQRADIYLNRILNEVSIRTGADTNKLYLYGHSGGGQFIHRLVLIGEKEIKKVFISAPGYYTFPNNNFEFPSGIRDNETVPDDIQMTFLNFCNTDTRVTVGEYDTIDKALPKHGTFGKNRVELATNWTKEMNQYLSKHCPNKKIKLKIVKGKGHNDASDNKQRNDVIAFFKTK